jgi:hypothetical protein
MNYTEILKRKYFIDSVDLKKMEKWKCADCPHIIKNETSSIYPLFKYSRCEMAPNGNYKYSYYYNIYKLKRCPLIQPKPQKPKKIKKIEMSHSECINRAANWLRQQHQSHSSLRCKIIFKEPHGYNISKEYPDILGTGMRNDVNIECKVSRQDFLKDGKKQHNHPFGNFKFYACPEGLIQPEEIPEEFGLLYVNKKTCRVIKKPTYVKECENTAPMLADLFLSRNKGAWDGKAIIL